MVEESQGTLTVGLVATPALDRCICLRAVVGCLTVVQQLHGTFVFVFVGSLWQAHETMNHEFRFKILLLIWRCLLS